MKIFGLSCGSAMGNSEILLKEALMGLEEVAGKVDIDIIRIIDLDIRPCKRCKRCRQREGKECIIKDDSPFVHEKFMECDAFIISSPVYGTIPPGEVLVLAERAFGARADVAGAIEQKKRQNNPNPAEEGFFGRRPAGFKEPPIDERIFKPRVGALIGVGGASSYEWVHLTLPLLYNVMIPIQVAIVDHLQVRKASFPGTVLLQPKIMQRVGQLGRNVGEALGKQFDEVEWKGDEPGSCPVCHSELFIIPKEGKVMCAICGIYGTIKSDGERTDIIFNKKEQLKSRVAIEGKRLHQIEIANVSRQLMPRMGEIPAMMEKYRHCLSITKPPRAAKN